MVAKVNSQRRRSEKSRVAIVQATRELLLERGFDGLTIKDVANRAGVGKQTIYRWWPSRPALVADVVLEDADKILQVVQNTGDLTADLTAWVGDFAAALTTVRGYAMLRVLMAASMEDEATADRLRIGFSTPLHETVQTRLLAEHIAEATAQAVSNALVGAVIYAILREGCSYDRGRAELTTRIIVDSLLLGAVETERQSAESPF